jgi:ribosome-binding factor A
VRAGQVRIRAVGESCLKSHKRRCKESECIDAEFTEALYEGKSNRQSSQRQAQRKAQQFCRQVQRALNLVLADLSASEDISGLFVEDVSPAPDCGHLLVHVFIPVGRPVADAIGALRRDAPRLRSEVATAITRKRAPELSFVPAYSGETDLAASVDWAEGLSHSSGGFDE